MYTSQNKNSVSVRMYNRWWNSFPGASPVYAMWHFIDHDSAAPGQQVSLCSYLTAQCIMLHLPHTIHLAAPARSSRRGHRHLLCCCFFNYKMVCYDSINIDNNWWRNPYLYAEFSYPPPLQPAVLHCDAHLAHSATVWWGCPISSLCFQPFAAQVPAQPALHHLTSKKADVGSKSSSYIYLWFVHPFSKIQGRKEWVFTVNHVS